MRHRPITTAIRRATMTVVLLAAATTAIVLLVWFRARWLPTMGLVFWGLQPFVGLFWLAWRSSHVGNAIAVLCCALVVAGIAVAGYWDTLLMLAHASKTGNPVIGAFFVPMLVPLLQWGALVVTAVVWFWLTPQSERPSFR